MRFRSITEQYYRKADGVLAMYDVTHSPSFTAVRGWMDTVKVNRWRCHGWLDAKTCKTVYPHLNNTCRIYRIQNKRNLSRHKYHFSDPNGGTIEVVLLLFRLLLSDSDVDDLTSQFGQFLTLIHKKKMCAVTCSVSQEKMCDGAVLMLLGNKLDLADGHGRKVTTGEGQRLAEVRSI